MLNDMYPGLGHDWPELLFGTTANLFYLMGNYIRQWEAIAARWAEGDHALLQPTEPCWLVMLLVVVGSMSQSVNEKQLELCGDPTRHYM